MSLIDLDITLPAEIGVSGGRSSGKVVHDVLEYYKGEIPKSLIFSFQNTGEECEETLEFLHEMETRWKLPLVWLEYWDEFNVEDYRKPDGSLCKRRIRGPYPGFRIVDYYSASRKGEPFDTMLHYFATYRKVVKGLDTPMLPNLRMRMCTSNLKIKTIERYMKLLGYWPFTRIVGIRYDEPARWSKMINSNRGEFCLPLYLQKDTRETVNEFWRHQSFDLKLDNLSIEGNCRHCFLKNPAKAVAIMKKMMNKNGGEPDAELQRWLWREEWAGMPFRRDRPTYSQLIQIAQEEMKTGVENKYDFSICPEYACTCEGMIEEEVEE